MAGGAERRPDAPGGVVEGRLTPERVLADVGGDPRELSVFMCGPAPMLGSFQTQLRKAGVRARHIHREYFDLR